MCGIQSSLSDPDQLFPLIPALVVFPMVIHADTALEGLSLARF
jgi:hypothetical protein